jgi:uncharacterized membrane protein
MAGAALICTDFMSLGGILVVVAFVYGNMRKKKAQDTLCQNHLRWMSRTFWIVNVYYLVTSILAGFYIVAFTSIPADMHAILNNGNIEGLTGQMQKIEDGTRIPSIIACLPPSVWWIHRCWQGLKQLKEGKPVANVTAWL